mmetsp:Transcript_11924/g.33738  ORF Transcript_11924/g.33738 Transcript_11924/m.33738 type:complete len:242 (+) Transcript_11924:705-1430(+)
MSLSVVWPSIAVSDAAMLSTNAPAACLNFFDASSPTTFRDIVRKRFPGTAPLHWPRRKHRCRYHALLICMSCTSTPPGIPRQSILIVSPSFAVPIVRNAPTSGISATAVRTGPSWSVLGEGWVTDLSALSHPSAVHWPFQSLSQVHTLSTLAACEKKLCCPFGSFPFLASGAFSPSPSLVRSKHLSFQRSRSKMFFRSASQRFEVTLTAATFLEMSPSNLLIVPDTELSRRTICLEACVGE